MPRLPLPQFHVGQLVGTSVDELAAVHKYLKSQHASSTQRAYAADWRCFRTWCDERGLSALPASAETVALFLSCSAEAGHRPSTLARRTAAIRLVHRSHEMESPTNSEVVKATMRGIRRELGTAPVQKAPALAQHIRSMAALADISTDAGARDRAILLLGFAGALRRSELVALRVEDLEETHHGFRITIRQSKTDPEGAHEVVPVVRGGECCPIQAVNEWRTRVGIKSGALFRRVRKNGAIGTEALSAYSVVLIIKKYAEKAGLDPSIFSAHSLRAGFLTSAAMNRASLFKLREVSRHKSLDILRTYVRRADEFEDHAGQGLL
jgi:site-specific recombinase XerD